MCGLLVNETSPFAALADSLSTFERKALPVFQAEEKRRAEAEFLEGLKNYTLKHVNLLVML